MKSDSQATFYEKSVRGIIRSNKKFKKFRRIYNYREILEHVDYKLGQRYLERTIEISGELCLTSFPSKLRNNFGRPWVYQYENIGKVSPTSLRYFAVSQELRTRFGDPKSAIMVEIGAGYGGQYLAISEIWNISEYIIYDLPEVQILISKYLSINCSGENVSFKSLNQVQPPRRVDLVVSNYAFSELPVKLQLEYLEKVILKADRGYLIMNSGRTNHSGRSSGKISLNQLKSLGLKILVSEEHPLTGPDNYVITWGPPFE